VTIEEQIAAKHEERRRVVAGIYQAELALSELNGMIAGGQRVPNYRAFCQRQNEVKRELMELRARAASMRVDLHALESKRALARQDALGALPRHVLEEKLTEALAEIERLKAGGAR